MLGTRSPQRGLFNAASRLSAELDQLGIYGQLARVGPRIFRDTDFAGTYAEGGRPSTPPSLLAIATLLQQLDRVSDAEVVERARYDLRWKVALDLDPLNCLAPFVKSTFQGFRVRLTLHEKEGVLFEKSVREAAKAGLLPKRITAVLDSSPVRGRGAVKDTFNLISDAIRAALRAVADKRDSDPIEEAGKAGVERHFTASSIKGEAEVDWDDAGAVSAFLAGLLKDCEKAVEVARKAGCKEVIELLQKIVDQDVDTSGDAPVIRDGVAEDRIVSVQDPEMRHGRKSSGKTYNGHKAHLAVEADSGLVTAVEVSAPREPDGSKIQSLVSQTEKLTGSEVERVIGDTAYGTRTGTDQAEEIEVDLLTKMPSPPEGKFGPGDFKVSQDGLTARCPAGHRSAKQIHANLDVVHHWSPDTCSQCPLRDQCLRKHKGKEPAKRTLTVTPDFHARRKRERRAKSPAGRALLRQRVVVEHAIARIKNLGAAASRYFGRAKTRFQWLCAAALVNLQLVWARTAVGGAAA